ncbi:hypothetical protein [Acinetobacter sp. ANC 4654]|nr:hypothetical protein [Acinetobacter sp. ANC 4654]
MDYEDDFYDQEKINAINTAKDNINRSDDHFLEVSESICAAEPH